MLKYMNRGWNKFKVLQLVVVFIVVTVSWCFVQ